VAAAITIARGTGWGAAAHAADRAGARAWPDGL